MMVTRTALAASAVIEIAAYIVFKRVCACVKFLPSFSPSSFSGFPFLRAQDPPLTGPLIAQTSEDHQDWVNTATDPELR
jgi:hypothetical protein